MKGKIIRGVGGNYFVHLGDQGVYMCRAKGIFRRRGIKPKVGDMVDIVITHKGDREGNIMEIYERKNSLFRPVVANVDQALVVFAAHEPEPNFPLLDTFLITMKKQDVPVIICFNKMDLAGEEEQDRLRTIYENSGCQLVFSAAAEGRGLDRVENLIRGKTTVLAGPSGVGKSSLLNHICRDTVMETGSVSEKIKRGRHTTRHAELIYVGNDSYIVDTPGFSSLSLMDMEKEELAEYFPEFEDYQSDCRFLDCQHRNEPDCAVKNAVDLGEISRQRYDSYLLLYRDLADRKKW